jgi:hypothetical protein
MKNYLSILLGVVISTNLLAQTPEKMSYQAVIRNANNNLVTNQPVGMRISVLQGSVNSPGVYIETHTPITNVNGLASLEIGGGNVVAGSFSAINWANGPFFIKTETDPLGGSNYSIIGTSQLLSVPYALLAKRAQIDNVADGDTSHWKILGNNTYYNKGSVGIGTNSPAGRLHSETPIVFANTLGAIRLHSNDVANYFQSGTSLAQGSKKDLYFGSISSSSANLVIKGDGNVGVGLTQPTSKLHVAGDVTTDGILNVNSNTNLTAYSDSGSSKIYSSNNNAGPSPFSNTGHLILQSSPTFGRNIYFVTGEGQSVNSPRSRLTVVGTSSATNIDVIMDKYVQIVPSNTPPANPSKGYMYFDGVLNKLRVYDGSTWQNCW